MPEVTLRVQKAAHKLSILTLGKEVWTAPVIVGRQPVGPKRREGDERTPEGEYRVCYRNAASRFHLFLGLSYPNADDALGGLATGVLSAAEYAALVTAHWQGERPNWYTALGGEIGIHGGGIDRAGTAGCVAMRDADVELVWGAVKVGTAVRILP